MSTFNPHDLIRAWNAHDEWAMSLTPPEGRRSARLPPWAGAEVTDRLVDEQKRAAEALGISTLTLVKAVVEERREVPGLSVAGAINRALTRLGLDALSTEAEPARITATTCVADPGSRTLVSPAYEAGVEAVSPSRSDEITPDVL